MSESSDIEMIMMYQNFSDPIQTRIRKTNTKPSKKMGYLGKVNDTKEF